MKSDSAAFNKHILYVCISYIYIYIYTIYIYIYTKRNASIYYIYIYKIYRCIPFLSIKIEIAIGPC